MRLPPTIPAMAGSDLVLRAAAQGQGVALARHRLAADDVASGLLFQPFGELSVRLETAYWIVLPRHTLPSAATEIVIAWLKREAAAQPAPWSWAPPGP